MTDDDVTRHQAQLLLTREATLERAEEWRYDG
jgi:hypothetical protein